MRGANMSVIGATTLKGMAIAIVLSATQTAFAFCGGPHRWAGEQATWLFRQGIDLNDPSCITADHGGWPLYPELLVQSSGWSPWSSYTHDPDESRAWNQYNWEYIRDCAIGADQACVATLNHFWLLHDGLNDESLGANNSWTTSYYLWFAALDAWNAGDLGWAYENLGYCMHHVQDLLQPAHSNADLHAGDGWDSGDDAIEEWLDQAHSEQWYAWDGSAPAPGPEVPYPNAAAKSNYDILADILNSSIPDVATEIVDYPLLAEPNSPYNMQKYFYLLYWANQTGSWFASDDINGQAFDPCGWMDYTGFPLHFNDGHEIWNYHGLDNNDTDCDDCTDHCRWDECDADWDLTLISNWTYAGVFKASPALIDLFRTTVDVHPPETTTDSWRADGEPVVEWNNSPVTVALTGATDGNNPGFRPSGLWKIWGLCDGNPPADYDNPSFLIGEDGKHLVELRSTDWCGNVEHGNDIDVWIDMTPPEITFPDLRPNYLTSEDFPVLWVSWDALSGVDSEYALLDGEQVFLGEVIDLAALAGLHVLEVYATDVAGNIGYAIYEFEVYIDATAWTRPVLVGDKTKGNGMFCGVQFPAPYDVGEINMYTCMLDVLATIDLTATHPIVGSAATLDAEKMTGVGDSNEDDVGDRQLRFDKEAFVAALGGQTGDINSVMVGGLGDANMPHFLAIVTVPVFTPSE